MARTVVIIAAVLVLSSCATQPLPADGDAPGFFAGFFHGLCIFFSLIASIFTDVRIYAFPNSGGWYDVGFFLGAGAALGGTAAGAR